MQFLRRLVDRARGTATPALRPRLTVPFEPVPGLPRMAARQRDGHEPLVGLDVPAALSDRPQAEPPTGQPVARARATPAHAQPAHEDDITLAREGARAAMRTPPEPPLRAVAAHRGAAPGPAVRRAVNGDDTGARPGSARSRALAPDSTAARRPDGRPRDTAAQRATLAERAAVPTSPTLTPTPTSTGRSADTLDAIAGATPSAAGSGTAPATAARTVAIDPARIRPEPVAPRRAPAPDMRQPGDVAHDEAAPVIRITIGRIDVRAVSDAPRQPAPRRRADPPRLGIDEYLNQRMRGDR
jgi:hypothetical protein